MNKVTSFRLGIRIFLSMLLAGATGILLSFLLIGIVDAKWAQILVQTIILLIYYSVIYSTAWKDGYTEMNRVQCGFSTFDPFKGLKAGLFAIIPSYLLWGLMVALSMFHVNFDGIYRIINFFAIYVINAFMDPNLAVQDIPFIKLLLSTCFIAFIPLLTFLAYFLGYKRFSFMELFVFKKKANAPTRESASRIGTRK